jgi:tetratricopeptide (TPR) repeat protein
MAGDFEAGKLVYEESLAIEESTSAYSNLGVVYYYLGEFENSVAMHHKAIELSPDQIVKWLNLADSLYLNGQKDAATKAFGRVSELGESRIIVDPTDFDTMFSLAWAQQMLGNNVEAKASVAKGLEIAPGDPFGHYYDALLDVQVGDYESALTSLQFAVDNGYPTNMLAVEPYLDKLRGNSVFAAMIGKTE